MTYCIIGAGAAGLAAGRRLKEKKIPFEIIERGTNVGGVWDVSAEQSPVYHSTHLISSKPLTEYPDYPMPKDYDDYPHHSDVLNYFKGFARDFDLYSRIRFRTTVREIERLEGEWRVHFQEGPTKTYAGLILASGFTAKPIVPKISGEFHGQVIHSKQYKSPEILAGKRVLIIGAGNSGCDIATEASKHAQKTFLSMRRGYYFIPKYLFGIPTDQFGEVAVKLRIPFKVRQWMNRILLRVVLGGPEKYGLPRPDHKLLESHPIINSHILKCAARGEVVPKQDVESFEGNQVRFRDGSLEEVDVVLFATGYLPEIPYMDLKHLNWQKDHAELYLHVFHPVYNNLFVLGMVQPDSGVWGIADAQARAVADFIFVQSHFPERATNFRTIKGDLAEDRRLRRKYLPSIRHHFEVEHSHYLRRLEQTRKILNTERLRLD